VVNSLILEIEGRTVIIYTEGPYPISARRDTDALSDVLKYRSGVVEKGGIKG
jgi:hypothetical protein